MRADVLAEDFGSEEPEEDEVEEDGKGDAAE